LTGEIKTLQQTSKGKNPLQSKREMGSASGPTRSASTKIRKEKSPNDVPQNRLKKMGGGSEGKEGGGGNVGR